MPSQQRGWNPLPVVLLVIVLSLATTGTSNAQTNPSVERARTLLEAQMPVSAASLLTAELLSGAVKDDGAVLVIAQAYSEQKAWESVRRALLGRHFADREPRAEATLLLARAYAGLDSTTQAIQFYRSYINQSINPPPLPARVGFAAALGRGNRWNEAAAQLALAERDDPDLGRWIRVSRLDALAKAQNITAFALADSIIRETPVVADSVLTSVAKLAFDLGDPTRGIATARRGSPGVWNALAADYIGPHLLSTGDVAGAIAAFRDGLTSGQFARNTGPELIKLDESWRTLRDVGRADVGVGWNKRGAEYLSAALQEAPEEAKPEIVRLLAGAYTAMGNPRRGIQILNPWIDKKEISSSARSSLWLLAARAFTQLGESTAADEGYENAAQGSGNAAALAAYLIADAHHDADRPIDASAAFERAYRRFSGSSYGSRSLERLALLDYHEGRYVDAKARLDEYRRRYPEGGWYQGAIYWGGKTEEAQGDTAAARASYAQAFRRDPLDYYGILASRKISKDRWDALRLLESDSIPKLDNTYKEALGRMGRLRNVGWTSRMKFEYREARRRGPTDYGQILAFAHALNEKGWTQEGIREGWRAKSKRVRWSIPLLKAIYPLPFREALTAAAKLRNLSPHFVAGLARRESMFDPEIRSIANAIGLMQLLPETARNVSARAGLPEYQRSQLTVPQVNLLLGTQYLADVLAQFDGFPAAGMISYNAGPHRYTRWRQFPEFFDEEQLVERIPFRETREYVRAVTELAEIYRFLYPDLENNTP